MTLTADPFALPKPDEAAPELPPLAGVPDGPPPPPGPDVAPKAPPKRPTTRAGRRAAAEAKKAAGKAEKKPASPKAAPRRAPLERRLCDSLTTIGTMTAGLGGMVNPAFTADGVLIIEHAESVSKALAKVAADQPHVAAALERMLTAGVYSGLMAALLPLVIGIMANHGAIPAGLAAMLATTPAPDPDADPAG